jgi:predicted nuclease of predicted toxin-antitoxin system
MGVMPVNRVTLEESKGRVIYVRCHATDEIPGEYRKAFDLEETDPGVWEAKIAMESMTLGQRRDFTKAVMDHGGIDKIIWCHYVDGVARQRETIFKKL